MYIFTDGARPVTNEIINALHLTFDVSLLI